MRGTTPLCTAAYTGNLHIVQHLCSLGANKERAELSSGETPLYCASAEGHLEVVQYFCEAGVNVIRESIVFHSNNKCHAWSLPQWSEFEADAVNLETGLESRAVDSTSVPPSH